MFSSRVPRDLPLNRLASSIAAHRASRRPLIDLTATNPTAVGIHYDADLLAPLSSAAALTYSPEPLGMRTARHAIAAEYAARGISVAGDRIVLTSSTSEAYSVLFKLLCAPEGDDVLVPQPSYPLFDHLTRLDGVSCHPYFLEYHGRWLVDERSVETALTPRTRAILAVTPNNPTGSSLSSAELSALTRRCADRQAAVILDEVFADYLFDEAADAPIPCRNDDQASGALTFRLGGLSKSAGLPQVKLGWIAIDGPGELVDQALDRLELICDTYLSVSTPVQVAAPALIERGTSIRRQIRERVRANFAVLREITAHEASVELLNADGGWSAVIRVPTRCSEEELVIALLDSRDTLVHPGFFFDFAHESFVVLSLLPPPALFAEGAQRVLEHVRA